MEFLSSYLFSLFSRRILWEEIYLFKQKEMIIDAFRRNQIWVILIIDLVFSYLVFDVGQTRYLTKHSLKTNKHCTFEAAAK